jgi:hypothetical protein
MPAMQKPTDECDGGDEEPPQSQTIPWSILILNFFATLALAFPFYTSYVALPQMMVSMNANLDEIQWVLTGYAIAQTVMMPTVGWEADSATARSSCSASC